MFHSASVCLFVSLFVCKNYWSALHEHFTRDVSLNKEEMSTCWKPSACGSGSRKFWRILLQFGSYLWKNRSDLDKNFNIDVSYDREAFVKFWKSSGWSGLRIWTPDSDRTRLGGGLRYVTALVVHVPVEDTFV